MTTIWRIARLTCVATALGAGAAAAQPAPWDLVGVIRMPDGRVIEGATVAIAGSATRSDAVGFFRLPASRRDTITIAVRRIGFVPISVLLTEAELTGDTLLIVLDPTAQHLETVTVNPRDLRSPSGFGGFEERRVSGHGVFVTRQEIERRNSAYLSDALRTKRGVQLVRVSTGGFGVRFAQFAARSTMRRCAPEIWLDGTRMQGMEVDEIPPNTVAGIELYATAATTPSQFTSGPIDRPCGTVVVWTREPGRQPRK